MLPLNGFTIIFLQRADSDFPIIDGLVRYDNYYILDKASFELSMHLSLTTEKNIVYLLSFFSTFNYFDNYQDK